MIVDELILELQAQSNAGRGKYVVTLIDSAINCTELESVESYDEDEYDPEDIEYWDRKGNRISGSNVALS